MNKSLPSISVIIPTHKRDELLQRCLLSLNKCGISIEDSYEVIIVDDGGFINLSAKNKFLMDNFKLVTLPNNLGQAAAQAAGVQIAKSDVLAFLDDDTEVDENWLSSILYAFDKYPNCGALLGKVNPIDTTHLLQRTRQQHYERRQKQYLDGTIRKELQRKYGIKFLQNDAPLCNHVSGCNFAIRRQTLEDVGGIPQNYKRGSDGVLARNLLRNKVPIIYNPQMIVSHYYDYRYSRLFKNNFHEGISRVNEHIKSASLRTLLKLAMHDFLLAPFRIVNFKEMLCADRFRIRAYVVYTLIQYFDAFGQIYQCIRFALNIENRMQYRN